jgi:lysophospholipase L1-like esterase
MRARTCALLPLLASLAGACGRGVTAAPPAPQVDGGRVAADGGSAANASSDAGVAMEPFDGGTPMDPPDAGAAPAADDGGSPDADAGAMRPAPTSVAGCFPNIRSSFLPNYDAMNPTLGSHCVGTNYQDITGVEKLVFLGDSITEGTPPTPPAEYYRSLLTLRLLEKFGSLEVADCAAFGAHTDDFFGGQNQIPHCFPQPESKRTLVVFTIGGNDIAGWAKADLSTADALAKADRAAGALEQALQFFRDPAQFPNGVFVVFANPYEYTDGTGELLSCPSAVFSGLSGTYTQGIPAILHFRERYLELAIRYAVDLVFMAEAFCGHGYGRANPASPCYTPANDLWFDVSCIHPDPAGHAALADLFLRVIDE